MSADEPQTLVFIHGVGGALAQDDWLGSLSNVMAQCGFSRPKLSGIEVATVDYRPALLAPPDVPMLRQTWRKTKTAPDDYSEYQVRRGELDRVIRAHKQARPIVGLGGVPDTSAEALAVAVESALRALRAEARRYRTDEKARAAVLERVVSQLPSRGRMVILAHSLGSVVAVDVIKRLPAHLAVDLLLTIGSPLAMRSFWPFVTFAGDAFPFGRVRSWVNVFDSLDPVTSGRGVGRWCPEATDVDVHWGSLAALVSSHASGYYLSLPVVGALVADSLYGATASPSPSASTPARRLGRAWDLYLLGAAYALQVSATCDVRKHRWRRNFDAARRASVSKLLTEIMEHEDALPEAARDVPTESDFLDHAAGLVKGTWSDQDLLPFAVALLMSTPVRPYEAEIAEDHAERALTYLLDRVRRDGSNLADPDFARTVAAAVKDARDVMGGRSLVWAYLMLGGAAVLAATGLGVLAAAPAGLAGAALLTSTLAALGPGGMVGGMVTIAAASSAGSALLGVGATRATQAGKRESADFVSSLARSSKEQLRATVTGWVARVIAEDKLSFASTAEQVKALLTAALTEILNEENAHRGLGSSGAKAWKERRETIERAMHWLHEHHPSAANKGVMLALTTSRDAILIDPAEVRRTVESRGLDPDNAIESR